MKIYLKKSSSKVLSELKRIFGNKVEIKQNKDFLEIKNLKPGYIYNFIPKIKNIDVVIKVENENKELCPLIYSKNYYFKTPINTEQKFIIAGPCVIHNFDEFEKEIEILEKLNINALRTPLFKPRSSPYGWEGYGLKGIKKLRELKKKTKLPFVGEIMDYRLIEKVYDIFDVIQIGARNMKNYTLLKEAGISKKPVLLKRQPKSDFKELIYSLEYLAKYGSKKIIICERGDNISDDIPSLDIEMIKKIKTEIKVPVIADLSHSTKRRELIKKYALKTKEIVDGFMIEVSLNPHNSPIDTPQILSLQEFKKLLDIIR